MSLDPSTPGDVPRRRGARFLLGLVFLLLAGAQGTLLWREAESRVSARDLLDRCALGGRPELVDTLTIFETADLASAFAAQACLARLAPLGAGVASGFGPDARAALASVRVVAAEGVDRQPGSALAVLLLGQAGHALWNLEARPAPEDARSWLRAYALSQAAAPGLDLVSTDAADAALGAWPRLSESDRASARQLIRRAWLSPTYVRNTFAGAWTVLGPDVAGWLPDSPDSLGEAAAALRAIGQSAAAEVLEGRRRAIPPKGAEPRAILPPS